MFLDTRHWASDFDKSLAHEDKPLVQEELRWFETLQVFVACTRGSEFLWLINDRHKFSVSVTKGEFGFANLSV